MSFDEQRLIKASLGGDTSAFGQLVCHYQDRLFNTVFRLLANAEDAQDVVQESFISAYLSLDGFKGDSRFFTWLYRIAINTAITHKRRKRPVLSIHMGRPSAGFLEPADDSETSQPGRDLEKAEEEKRLQDALLKLSPEHRSVLILKDIEGQKYEEIAEVLEVPIGTVRSRLHRARTELREILEQNEGP